MTCTIYYVITDSLVSTFGIESWAVVHLTSSTLSDTVKGGGGGVSSSVSSSTVPFGGEILAFESALSSLPGFLPEEK